MRSLRYGIKSSLGFISQTAFALCECHEQHVVAFGWNFLHYFLDNLNLSRLLGKLTAKVVDLCVKCVYLRLISQIGKNEVVSSF